MEQNVEMQNNERFALMQMKKGISFDLRFWQQKHVLNVWIRNILRPTCQIVYSPLCYWTCLLKESTLLHTDLCADVNCGEHGICDKDKGVCTCSDGYTGDNCNIPQGINSMGFRIFWNYLMRYYVQYANKCVNRSYFFKCQPHTT